MGGIEIKRSSTYINQYVAKKSFFMFSLEFFRAKVAKKSHQKLTSCGILFLLI